ncbi:MAG: hypothetical protein AVDCRST_MAG18-4921 [uncultured Thermomicrobiales bacterium]|uniref:DUF2007 domain-containing protein n=1 Tax=uncultured Thermomicrobiales bacterium TaxID=1645740 RepID=A0A6J4VW77_9BACT|nr:MAG: hypothetical protein AVDCRST_MAG18-4921 [uncultured Thermomicrobiales bacterium]
MSERDQGGQLTRIASAPNAVIAEMWKELLGNEGIPALIRMAGPLTGYVTFASAHDLLVLASDAEEARELLAAFNENAGDFVADDEAAEGDWSRPEDPREDREPG